jgi:hypothetical protein
MLDSEYFHPAGPRSSTPEGGNKWGFLLTTPYPFGIGKLSSTSTPKFSGNPSYRKVHPEKGVERGGLPKRK